MSRRSGAEAEKSTDNAGDADECDSLVDKLKGGDYGEMIKVAQKAQDAQQLCVTAAGIKKGDPYSCFARADPYPAAGPTPPPAEDPDEEIKKLRAARMDQMKQNAAFRQQGHGSLRELA